MVKPTVVELRLLRPSSLSLWRALIRCRDRGGLGEAEWFIANLQDLAKWARISYRAASWSLNELRTAGLIAMIRVSESCTYRHPRTLELTQGRVMQENAYLILGSLKTHRHNDIIEFPAAAWEEFKKTGRAQAYFKVPKIAGFQKVGAMLHPVSAEPYNTLPLLCNRIETSKKGEAPVFSSCREERSINSFDELLKLPIIGPPGPRPELTRQPGRAPKRIVDRPPKPPSLVHYISPEQVPELKAQAVVDGYRRAVAEVYGIEWWHYSKGDLTKARFYDRLLAAGVAMSEHSVPPKHWAIWRLRWFKDHVKKFSSSPPPVFMVMSAKAVHQKAGWFRTEYVLPVATYKLDPVIHEQQLRNKEAYRRWEGYTGRSVFMMVFPKWYYELRRKEIARGFEDPLELWPTVDQQRLDSINIPV